MAAVTSPTAAFTTVSLLASLTLLGYAAYVVLYRLFLHPLKSFPGPKLAAASFLYEIYFDVCKAPGGQYIYEIERLHEIYGPVVRINPEEIHVKDSEWFDVLFAGPGHVRNKSERANRANGATGSVASTVRHDLHRLRRSAINPFFSKRAVTQLEDKVRSKIDLMCERLRERATSGEVVNIGGAFTAVTLDVISEYCYDESYNALDTPDLGVKWNKVMGGIFESVPVTKHFPVVGALMQALPPSVIKLLNPDLELFMTTKAMTDNQSKKVWEEVQNKKEKSSTTEAQGRPRTIFHGIMESSLPVTEKSVERLCDEAFVLVVAGGETTARVSTVILVGLLKKPDLFARLRRDIDAATKDGFPDGQRLEGIAFMKAVVQEGVRMAAPVTNRPIQVAPNEDLECHDWILPRGVSATSSSHFAEGFSLMTRCRPASP